MNILTHSVFCSTFRPTLPTVKCAPQNLCYHTVKSQCLQLDSNSVPLIRVSTNSPYIGRREALFNSRQGQAFQVGFWSHHLVFSGYSSFLPSSKTVAAWGWLFAPSKPSHSRTPLRGNSLNLYISIYQPSIRKFCELYHSGVQTAQHDGSCKLCALRKDSTQHFRPAN